MTSARLDEYVLQDELRRSQNEIEMFAKNKITTAIAVEATFPT